MRGRQVVIVAAIVVGLLASIVASLVTDVQWSAAPTSDPVCARALEARSQVRLDIQTGGRPVSAITIVQLKSQLPQSPTDATARPKCQPAEIVLPRGPAGSVRR
jgi:hypothetical protein